MPIGQPENHDHVFGQDKPRPGENRTLIVVAITLITMVVEITAGVYYGSMALLADGLHMASHAVALGIAAFAYRYARRHAADPRFSFGTGKVNALAGYSGAVLLGVFATWMAVESVGRFISPVHIAVNQALVVAVLGLLVNGASVLILGVNSGHGGHHHHNHEHHHHDGQHDDHNFRAAYFHVLADALTSFLAIGALLSAKYFGLNWLDPAMGIVGAILVANWSVGLLRESGKVLVDRQVPDEILEKARQAIEGLPDSRVTDLHIWSIGPGIRAAIISVDSVSPREPGAYQALIPPELSIVHSTIEVRVTAAAHGQDSKEPGL